MRRPQGQRHTDAHSATVGADLESAVHFFSSNELAHHSISGKELFPVCPNECCVTMSVASLGGNLTLTFGKLLSILSAVGREKIHE